jgi:LysR family transcriptional regulator, low CO2-responsive transcriptional regulator
VIRELKKAHSNLELQVTSGDTADILKELRANKLDLGIGVAAEQSAGLEQRPLFRDELMFTFAPSHPWASGKPIRLEDLRKQPLILYQHASLTARLLDDFFHGLNFTPSSIMEIDCIGAIKELVKLDLGVAVLAPWTAEEELARGKLRIRPLGPKALRRHWATFYLAGRRLALVEENFYKLCRRHAAGLRLDRKDVPK